MERGKRERTGGDAQQPVLGQRSGEPERQEVLGLHPVREQRSDFWRQAAQCEGQRLCRGRSTLNVVDGEQHRTLLGPRCEHADESGCCRTRGGSVAGLVPDESTGDGALLDFGKGRSHLIERLDDQIRERNVGRFSSLSAGCAWRPHTLFPCAPDTLEPQRGRSDPGLALDDDCARPLRLAVGNRSIAASSTSRPKIPSTPPPLRREDLTVGSRRELRARAVQRCSWIGPKTDAYEQCCKHA